MVFESLIRPKEARRKPFKLFLIGVLFSIIAVLFSLWVFESQASMVMVLLLVLMSVPLMYVTLFMEEKYGVENKSEKTILKHHGKTLIFLSLLFLGFVVGLSLIYLFFPGEVVTNLFSAQQEAISSINASVVSGSATSIGTFFSILLNNVKVLIFCIFFAFFFGAGAIFILAWNASVIAAAVGNFFREAIANYANSVGFYKGYMYFHIFGLSLLRYLTHGVFEILAYFVGGLAGGIISVGIMRHGLKDPRFGKVLYDALVLVVISFFILILAGLIEVYVTPLLF